MQAGADPATATKQALAALYGTVQQQAALLSFVDVFRIMGWMFIIITPAVFLMKKAGTAGKSTEVPVH